MLSLAVRNQDGMSGRALASLARSDSWDEKSRVDSFTVKAWPAALFPDWTYAFENQDAMSGHACRLHSLSVRAAQYICC